MRKTALRDCFLGRLEVGFLVSVLLVPTKILCIVRGICAPMFLPEVAMLLGSSFLWNFVSRLCTRTLVSFLVFCRSFLVGLCIGSFLGTYALNSLKALKKQMHVHRIQSFLVMIELILPRMWAHPKNVTG